MEPTPVPIPERKKSIDNPWMVLAVLFLVTGCLGVPLLFMSRGFSTPARIGWTIVSIVYTALLLWGFALVMKWCWGQIAPALS